MRFPRRAVALLLAAVLAGCGVAVDEPSSPPPSPTPAPTVAPPPSDCPVEPDPGQIEGWDVQNQAPTVIPVVTNVRLTCGTNRVVIGLLSPENVPVAAPDRTLRARFFDLSDDPGTPSSEATGLFTWAIEGTTGLYIMSTDFDNAGAWGVEIVTQPRGGPEETIRLRFPVAESTPTIRVGQEAPATDTPTAADVGGDLALVSTDAKPEPSFYDTSIADAVEAKRPFVVAFATPKFCTSATCGPTLDRLKPFAKAWPSIDFINVEPYVLEPVDGQLQPVLDPNDQLTPAPWSTEWGLLTEPVVFVVDAEGTVRAAFEGAFADEELRAALAAIDVPAE
jgi:hypothetical protein